MELNLLKSNLLAIIGSGIVMSLAGVVLFLVKEQLAAYIRYLLVIPPVGVASYVFVFNLLKKNNGKIPSFVSSFLLEVAVATCFAAVIFFVFTVLLGLFIGVFDHQ